MTTRIALIGNPNCGKSTLFNGLTGLHQKVGNWPGVTVERVTGQYRHAGQTYEIIDLPGVYGLDAQKEDDAIDERIAREFLRQGDFDLIVNILDAATLERGLYLTSQLLELNRPITVVLNMMDIAQTKGIDINIGQLSDALNCSVEPLVANGSPNLTPLRDMLARQSTKIQQTVAPVASETASEGIASAGTAESPSLYTASGIKQTASLEQAVKTYTAEAAEGAEANTDKIKSRYQWVDRTFEQSVRTGSFGRQFGRWLDTIFLNRFLALPIFLACMYLVFFLTINIGSAFIDLFDGLAGALVVELPRTLLVSMSAPDWLTVFIADGVGGGVQLVASFLPVIGILFLCLAFLEGTGYMSRVAFIVDRLMVRLGLPGKSFVPLIVGFGCNVPSVMATRTLERHQDRLLATIMAPFMSCGARLTVYALFAAAFFPDNGLRVVFGLYLIGIGLAVLSGLTLRRFMLEGSRSPFIMELPQYHLPTLHNILLQTWYRLRGFVVRAGKAIVAVVIVLNIINSWGTDGTFGNENMEKSWLSEIGKTITPAFSPMGITRDNWPATVGIFTGIFAKEVVVGTLDSLYGRLAEPAPDEDAPFSLSTAVVDAFATVPANLSAAMQDVSDPLGFSIVAPQAPELMAEEQGVRTSTLTVMSALFGSSLAAFSYLLFVLLYVPCVATLGAIYKEYGSFWMVFSALWSTIIAYAVAVMMYQTGALVLGLPHDAGFWLPLMALLMLVGYSGLILAGRRQLASERLISVIQIN